MSVLTHLGQLYLSGIGKKHFEEANPTSRQAAQQGQQNANLNDGGVGRSSQTRGSVEKEDLDIKCWGLVSFMGIIKGNFNTKLEQKKEIISI